MERLTRGELAKSSGVGIEAVRFYEEKGLIAKPKRTAAGYRQYAASDAKQIRFIKRAQELGFTLKEIKTLLDLQATSKMMCGDVKKRADQKYLEVERKISDLRRIQQSLKAISKCCGRGEPTKNQCPILDCFEGNCR